MKKRKISLIFLLLLLSALCLVSIGIAWKEYADRESDRHAFEELAQMVELPEETTVPATETTDATTDTTDTTAETTDTPTEPEPVEQKRNLAPIMEQNGECIGWICIEGTAVNYPVMHTPSDPQKYLRKNFEGAYSVSGVPFLDYRCTLETNLIIYGHNMKNGTMFSDLKKYLDKTFREQHPVIELETADGLRYFTVTEVVKTDIYDKRYEDIESEDGRQKLILSTCYCINHKAKYDIACIAQGKSVVHVRPEEVEKITINYPSKLEQLKILQFLELLTLKIAKQKSLIESLKLYKRGVSEALFERKIRFGCESSVWHTYTMAELGEFYNGLSGKGKDDFGSGNAEYITYMNVYKNPLADITMCETVKVTETEKQNKVQYGDVLFSQSSETLEEVGMSSVWLHKTTPYLNSFCFGFRFNQPENVYPLYIAYYMRSMKIRRGIMREGQGATRINLSAERLKSLQVELPAISEQKQIGDFLNGIDNQIINAEKLLLQTFDLKKSLLQKLFV